MYIEFKPGEKHASKGADTAETPDSFRDAGWLLEKDEVVVDIDSLSKDQIREFLKRFNIKTQIVWTDRGAHLYFRKSPGYSRAKNGACAAGFPIESKTSSNSPNGVTIKRNGILREIENPGVRELIPWYFCSGKQFTSLMGLGDGEGRNNALFSHKQKLDNSPDTETICRFINEVLFDKPLEENEFNQVVRSWTGGTGAETEYDHATNIINEYRTIYCFGEPLLIYKKIRPYVVGDGKHTLSELAASAFGGDMDIADARLDRSYVPSLGEEVTISWKHNLGQGAEAEVIDKDSEIYGRIVALAKKAAECVNVNFASIDIIDTAEGLKILEINSGIMMENFSSYDEQNYSIAKSIYKRAIDKYFETH